MKHGKFMSSNTDSILSHETEALTILDCGLRDSLPGRKTGELSCFILTDDSTIVSRDLRSALNAILPVHWNGWS